MLKKILEFKFILFIMAIMVFVLAFGDILPETVQIAAYSASTLIRMLLLFLIPILVLPFIICAIASLRSKGPALVFSLIFLILLSNFISTLIGGGVGAFFVPSMALNTVFDQGDAHELASWINFELEPFVKIEMTLLVGFLVGFYLSLFPHERVIAFFNKFRAISHGFFKNIFIPVLPIYIFGTLLQIDAENDFSTVFHDFGNILLLIFATQILYVLFLFFIGSRLSLSKTTQAIKNCIPAGLLGFSTMSSLVTMPVTLDAAEENLEDKKIAQIAIPATVNCHIVGESISMATFTISIYLIANAMALPDFSVFAYFAFLLALAQFTGVSVPGGSAVVIIPVLSSYLGFTPEMIGLLTTLAIFVEPVGTAFNVLGNSAFALIIERYFALLDRMLPKNRKTA
jgi:Na+/H+-dicarboxylate symporter